MRTYGLLEEYYTEARRQGILFFQYDPEEPPHVYLDGDDLKVIFKDHILQMNIAVKPDALVLSAGMRATETAELSSIMKLSRNNEGYFMEAHVKLRPVDMASEGVFVCGTAHSPKLITEAVSQAMARFGPGRCISVTGPSDPFPLSLPRWTRSTALHAWYASVCARGGSPE